MYESSSYSTSLLTLSVVSLNFSYSNCCTVLTTNDIEHLFVHLLAICLCEISVQVSAHFKVGLFVFLIFELQEFFTCSGCYLYMEVSSVEIGWIVKILTEMRKASEKVWGKMRNSLQDME